jgi:hypothetical protein
MPVPDLNDFLGMVLTWSRVQTDNNLQKDAAWHIVSSTVNKHADG